MDLAQNNKIRFVLLGLIGIVLILNFNNCGGPSFKVAEQVDGSSSSSCRLRDGLQALSPGSVDEAVELINRIEKPVTISCLLSFLPKPLQIYAVNNQASAQPAGGPESPRVFIFNRNLIISVVPDGLAKEHVEFGEVVGPYRSIKAELKFPITSTIVTEDAFETITDGMGGTSCRGCHADAVVAPQYVSGAAFITDMVLPNASQQVPASQLQIWANNCQSNSYRCEMLKTLMIQGQAIDAYFLAAPYF